ncbi:MAG: hypothetical protein AN488_03995 [Anabaena sp. WA113]|nr:MAG: hypothetical protein AN488_03995 [Anabaena sp. WA113]
MTEAQIANWETSALTTPGNLAPQYFETRWVTTTLLVQGGLKEASQSRIQQHPDGNNNPPSTGWVESPLCNPRCQLLGE